MDFENLMVTPAIYRDIPSSMMFSPYLTAPYMAAPMMMPPLMGITGQIPPMQPGLQSDTFQRLEAKNKESKKSMTKAGIVLAAMTVAGWFLSKRVKFPAIKKFNLSQTFKNLFKKPDAIQQELPLDNIEKKSLFKNYIDKFRNNFNRYTDMIKQSSWFEKLKNLFKKSK